MAAETYCENASDKKDDSICHKSNNLPFILMKKCKKSISFEFKWMFLLQNDFQHTFISSTSCVSKPQSICFHAFSV